MVLSLVDLGVGALCNPLLTMSLIYDLMHSSQCWAYDYRAKSLRPTTLLSFSIVAALSTERYFGVVHPFIHRTRITKVKLSLILLFIWSSCALVSFPAYFQDNPLQSLTPISIVFLFLITICCYMKIAYTVISSELRRQRLIEDHPNPNGRDSETAKKNRMDILHFLKELKMAKSSFAIVLCYFMCYTPSVLVFAVLRKKLSPLTQFYIRPWCLLFVMLNSTLNSIIFFWRSAPLRNEAKNVLKSIKLKCSPQ
jgi:hypothetical protein